MVEYWTTFILIRWLFQCPPKSQAMAYSRREVALLKQEGYTKAVYNSMLVDLSTFHP